MDDQVAEPAADDRAGDDPDRDEHDVVGAQPGGPGQDAGQQERRGDHAGQSDRAPAHAEIAEQLGIRVEVEEDDGDRHGGDECIEGGP